MAVSFKLFEHLASHARTVYFSGFWSQRCWEYLIEKNLNTLIKISLTPVCFEG